MLYEETTEKCCSIVHSRNFHIAKGATGDLTRVQDLDRYLWWETHRYSDSESIMVLVSHCVFDEITEAMTQPRPAYGSPMNDDQLSNTFSFLRYIV